MKKRLVTLLGVITLFSLVGCAISGQSISSDSDFSSSLEESSIDSSFYSSVESTSSEESIETSSSSESSSSEDTNVPSSSSEESNESIESSEQSSESSESSVPSEFSESSIPSESTESSESSESTSSIPEDVYYKVIFLDEDGTKLDEVDVLEGEDAAYTGEEPTKEEDDDFTYKFIGWDKDITCVTEDITTKAVYEAVAKENWGPIIWF